MDCRRFHDLHLGFLDDSLPDAELVAMQRHSTECTRCQRHDTAVRHGLLLFRNQPAIEPSADFSRRLDARLSWERHRQALTATTTTRGPGLGAFAAAAAGVVAFGYVAAASFDLHRAPELRFEPVVATAPADPLLPAANPALVAHGVSTGMPVWPAALMTQQVPATMFTLATWSR